MNGGELATVGGESDASHATDTGEIGDIGRVRRDRVDVEYGLDDLPRPAGRLEPFGRVVLHFLQVGGEVRVLVVREEARVGRNPAVSGFGPDVHQTCISNVAMRWMSLAPAGFVR